jgi:hypothetical protein
MKMTGLLTDLTRCVGGNPRIGDERIRFAAFLVIELGALITDPWINTNLKYGDALSVGRAWCEEN